MEKRGEIYFDDLKYDEAEIIPNKLKRVELTVDLLYWAILPCVNFNFHFPEFEIEWLCFGFYLRFGKL